MERLKVLHVLYSGLGGHGNVVFPLLESDFGERFENQLVFFGIEPLLPAYRQNFIEKGVNFQSILKKPRKYLRAFSKFREILAEYQPNRIIIHSNELVIPSVRYSKTTDCKVFYVEHENNDTKGLSLRYFTKYALTRADGVVCLNQNYADELKERYNCNAPISVISNGINTEKFKPSEKRITDPIIGMASRMIPGKDHTTLLQAIQIARQQIPNIKLKIAGDGETYVSVKSQIKTLSLDSSVELMGLLSEDEMVQFYNSIALSVLATKSETLSTTILQSMSCGLPVITSDIKNNSLLIESGKTGWLYRDGDAADLAKKIILAFSDLQVSKKIGTKAREKIMESFSNQTMSYKYSALIQ